MAMLGITCHSEVPLRLATMAGLARSAISLLIALGYLALKLARWDDIQLGMAPILSGFFFFAPLQLFSSTCRVNTFSRSILRCRSGRWRWGGNVLIFPPATNNRISLPPPISSLPF